ncbi:MAG: regulatory protein GemA [Luteimonas sp.]|nr:regulatory protein GemA [Luteimonas sp.]
MKARRDDRNIQIGRIKAAQKGLGLDDATYRSLLQRVTGKSSTTQMTPAERNAVIAEFARLGFKRADGRERAKGWRGKPKNVAEVPMLRKVEALLADNNRQWAYAHALAKKMFHVEKVEWLHHDQLHKLVAALQADANRRSHCDQ